MCLCLCIGAILYEDADLAVPRSRERPRSRRCDRSSKTTKFRPASYPRSPETGNSLPASPEQEQSSAIARPLRGPGPRARPPATRSRLVARRSGAGRKSAVRGAPLAAARVMLSLVATLALSGGGGRDSSRQRERNQREIVRRSELRSVTVVHSVEPAFSDPAAMERCRTHSHRNRGRDPQRNRFRRPGQAGRRMLTLVQEGTGCRRRQGPGPGAITQGVSCAPERGPYHEAHFTGLGVSADQEAVRRSTPAGWWCSPDRARKVPGRWDRFRRASEQGARRDQGRLLRASPDPGRRGRPAGAGIAAAGRGRGIRPANPVLPSTACRSAWQIARATQPGRNPRRAKAKAIQTSSAIDHFLSGQEHYKRKNGSPHYPTSTKRSLLGTRALLGTLPGQPFATGARAGRSRPRPAERLLQTEPGFAWLYELRGIASYQVAAIALHEAGGLETKDSMLLRGG